MTKSKDDVEMLSTTRLAKKLGVDGKALFALLSDQNWIQHEDDKWLLTAQGEYHGGQYQHSEKYGDYVVWPISLADHAVLQQLEGLMLSATKLADYYQTSAATINLLFSHLGWIDKDQRGWMPTELGKKFGAEVRSSKQGFYVMWPAAIRNHPLFVQAIDNLTGKTVGQSLDGRHFDSAPLQRLCNWFYLHGLVHATEHLLPGQDFLKADFYLPQRKVFIDYWNVEDSKLPLSLKLEKDQYYQKQGLKYIELSANDLDQVDDVLPKKLLQYGVQLH